MGALVNALVSAFPALLGATELTIACAVVAALIALALGIPAGFGRVSRAPLVRSLSTFYVETIRGTPLLLQLFVWYYGVSIVLLTLFNLDIDTTVYQVLTALNSNSFFPTGGVSSFFFAVVGLGFNYGAYMAEVVRAGIQAVDPGEVEAAHSLGLSNFQTSRLVVLPQALRLMTPSLTNNLITLVQDTSFLQVLGIAELSLVTYGFTTAISSPSIRWTFYGVALLEYFVICYALALVSQWYERRTAHTLAGAH